MNDWETTLELGQEFEDYVVGKLSEGVCPLAIKNLKKTEYSYYDIILYDGKLPMNVEEQKTVECKFDKLGKSTGNICIEIGQHGRWSGLFITKADYWVISDGEIVYVITPDNIRKCINENRHEIGVRYKPNENVLQENGKYKEMDIWLIAKRFFEPYCEEIGNINEIKFKTLESDYTISSV